MANTDLLAVRFGIPGISPRPRVVLSPISGTIRVAPIGGISPPPPPLPLLQSQEVLDPKTVKPLSGLKQRLLAFLYRQAVENGTQSAMRHYYMTFEQFASLVMWRIQFIDESTILIKFGGVEASVGRALEPPTSQTVFFAIYNLETTRITAVFDNMSHEFLELFESFPQLRGFCEMGGGAMNFITTGSNNMHAREFVKKQLYSVRKAKNGGVSQAVKRVFAAIPPNPQMYIESPYLDQVLFNYDESVINNINRPKPLSGEFAVKFWDRQTRSIRFKIDPFPANGTSRAK
ncbi:acid phosphatase det1 [Physocladia obscura]|uniref:Acid phosphatase det1 n=1 Tax=Physocladia obscura TaxID=109957 RepID=A0AAD5X9P5_9FUNG|nr:acid phosphatase det1 [Physocladia obscura]